MPKAEDGRHFVYIIRDPLIEDSRQNIIYVGKGTGGRPVDHINQAQQALAHALSAADDNEATLISHKIERLQGILATNGSPDIDVIVQRNGKTMDEGSAFLVEAGIIAALRMTELGNEIEGHGVVLVPENVFTRSRTAEVKTIDARYGGIVVPLTPGAEDYARFGGHLLMADDDHLWERSRGDWTPVGRKPLDQLESMMETEIPPILLTVSTHPFDKSLGIIIAVNQLTRVYESGRKIQNEYPDGTLKRPYFAWRFRRSSPSSESPSTKDLRARLLGHTLSDNGEAVRPGQRFSYFGSMTPKARQKPK